MEIMGENLYLSEKNFRIRIYIIITLYNTLLELSIRLWGGMGM